MDALPVKYRLFLVLRPSARRRHHATRQTFAGMVSERVVPPRVTVYDSLVPSTPSRRTAAVHIDHRTARRASPRSGHFSLVGRRDPAAGDVSGRGRRSADDVWATDCRNRLDAHLVQPPSTSPATAVDTMASGAGVYTLSTGPLGQQATDDLGPQAGVDARPIRAHDGASSVRARGRPSDFNGLSQGVRSSPTSDVTIDGFRRQENSTTALIDSLGSERRSPTRRSRKQHPPQRIRTGGGSRRSRLTAISNITVGSQRSSPSPTPVRDRLDQPHARVRQRRVQFNEVHDLGSAGPLTPPLYPSPAPVSTAARDLNVPRQGQPDLKPPATDATRSAARGATARTEHRRGSSPTTSSTTRPGRITINVQNTSFLRNYVYHNRSAPTASPYVEQAPAA